MKKALLLLVLGLSVTITSFAQRQETLFNQDGFGLSGIWFGTSHNYSYFDDDWALSRGGYGGLEFGRAIFVGWGNFRIKDQVKLQNADNAFDLKYGGLMLGLTPNSHKVAHPRVNFLAGNGRIRLDDGSDDRVFVMQPSAGVEVNVFKWFHIGLEGGYRFVMDNDLAGINSEELSSPFAQIDLRFGISWGSY